MHRQTPLVSFVVTTYNAAQYVGDCLRGIFAQTATDDYEIIVIDDASSDNTSAVLQTFDDPRLTYVRHAENMGQVPSYNEGLLRASGQFIARIDSDDRHRPHFLAHALPVLAKHPQVGLVYGDAALMDEGGVIRQPSVDTRHGGRDFYGDEYLGLLEENFITSPTVLVRREAWTRILPIPAGVGYSDWYLSLRVARDYPLYFVNAVLADYRTHTTNLHSAMLRDYREEAGTRRLLDLAFAEPDHAAEKQQSKNRIYAVHAARLGDKYFGNAMYADARRCYWQAARLFPRTLIKPGLVRRMAATYSPDAYARVKRAVRTVR